MKYSCSRLHFVLFVSHCQFGTIQCLYYITAVLPIRNSVHIFSLTISGGRRVRYGEAERRTLLNLIQAIDKNQVLFSHEKSFPYMTAKHELWKQVAHSFNDITGRNVSMEQLNGVLKRMKRNDFASGACPRTYLEYDKDLRKWIFLWVPCLSYGKYIQFIRTHSKPFCASYFLVTSDRAVAFSNDWHQVFTFL